MSHYRERDLTVIIAGGGRVGRETATLLQEYGHKPVIIEYKEERVAWLRDNSSSTTTIIAGDASESATLEDAGITDADVLFACTEDTQTNLDICTLATDSVPDIRTIVRSDKPPETIDHSDGIDAFLYPERAGARSALNEIFGLPVQTLAEVSTNIEIIEIEADPDAPATGKSLSEIQIPSDATVITDLATDHPAGGETVVQSNHRYLIATHPDVVDDLKKLFRG